MSRAFSLGLLWLSPVLISLGVGAYFFALNAERVEFGSKRPGWPIVLAAVGVWLIHLGFHLGPWLWSRGRSTTALWLMCPLSLVAMMGWLYFAARFIFVAPKPDATSASQLFWALGLVGCFVAYVGPVVVHLNAQENWVHRLVRQPAFAAVMAGLSLVAGVGASLTIVTLLLASGANSRPGEASLLKKQILAVALVGAAGLATGVWAWVQGRPWLAAVLGSVPVGFVLILLAVMMRLQF